MAKILIKRLHGVSLDEAKKKAVQLIDDFMEEHPKLVKDVTWGSDGLSAKANGRGFTGDFRVDAEYLHADIDLNFLVSPMKARIEASFERRLNRAFGTDSG